MNERMTASTLVDRDKKCSFNDYAFLTRNKQNFSSKKSFFKLLFEIQPASAS